MRWKPPCDDGIISEVELGNITDNIREAFRFDNKDISVWGESEGERPLRCMTQKDRDDLLEGNEKTYEEYLREQHEEYEAWKRNKKGRKAE
jgi:hypothetical protein